MANRKEYDMLFNLNASLGSSYNSTFSKAQKELISMQEEINTLNKTQADVSAYRKQQSAVEASQQKLEELQAKYTDLQRVEELYKNSYVNSTDEIGVSTEDFSKKYEKLQDQIYKAAFDLQGNTEELGKMSEKLAKAGINTNELEKESKELGEQLDALKQKQVEAAEKANGFGAVASQAFAAVQQAIVAAGIAKALKEIYDYFAVCAEASMEFESAMTGVDKTTDLTADEFREMSAALKEMSTAIPATTTELAGIAEAAGQLGIAKDGLTEFTEIMAMLGTATNMTSSEAATMLAQFTSITGMNPAYYSNLGSAIVALGNNYATTEKNVADMSQTIAAAASIAGMSEADIIGISAAVTSLGISSQNGGTQMNKLISEMNTAVSSGNDLEKWAAVARMSADDFAVAWGNNAANALDLFIQGLNKTYESGQDVYGVLAELGITETRMVTMMTSLAKSGDRLTNTLETSNAAWAENNALAAEAEKRYETTQSKLTLLQNVYSNLQVAIGDAYTPALRDAYSAGADVLSGVTEFVESNPELVRAVMAATSVFLTATTAVIGLNAALKAYQALKAAALLPSGPILAAIAVISLLTAGAVALATSEDETTKEIREMSLATREQYYELQALESEYKSVVDAIGETKYEAMELKRELDDATAAFEENRRTAEDVAKAHQETMEAYNEMVSAFAKISEGIDIERQSAESLISKLEELAAVEDKSEATKQQILTVVELLNEAVPNLGLAYDSATDSLTGFSNSAETTAEAIRAIAKAEYDRQRNAADHAELQQRYKDEAKLAGEVEEALKQQTAAQNELNTLQEEYDNWIRENGGVGRDSRDTSKAMQQGKYIRAIETAKKTLNEANSTVDEATAAYEDNDRAIQELSGSMADYENGLYETEQAQQAVFVGLKETEKLLDDVTTRMEELGDAYTDAYDDAYKSVEGQYELWEKADKVVATSAKKINDALESQASYWSKYNDNIEGLTSRSEEIEGLADVIASFADGSSDSVNAIAGMAKASDKDLAKMVENWQAVKKEQDTFATSMAELKTNFTEKMGELQHELEAAIEDMEMGSKAAESGRETIQGFIDSADAMLPAVEAAYARISRAALDALGLKDGSIILSGGLSYDPYIDGSHAKGLDYVPFDGYLAELHQGERVLTAEEAEYYTFAPQLIAALSARSNVLSADIGGGGGDGYHIQISPAYNISGIEDSDKLQAVLSANNASLKELIAEVLDDRALEAARRGYR